MADDDLLGGADEAEEDEEEEESGGGGSPLMKYLPIIGIVLVVQIVMVYLVATWWLAPSGEPTEPEVEQVAEAEGEAALPQPGGLPPGQVTVIFEKLEPIVINPAGTEGMRFLSATVHLGLSSPEVLGAIEGNNLSSKIRDRLIDLLRAKTIDRLDPSHHAEIKEEIVERLNEFLGENAVLEVYFQGFVLQ